MEHHDHHDHPHTHEHTHDGHTHTHEHTHHGEHCHDHPHTHEHTHDGHTHTHEHTHEGEHAHSHEHCSPECCASCGGGCGHTAMEELTALIKYMVGHNAAHAQELAVLARQLDEAGQHMAYEQVMQAVADFEKGNMRLSMVLAALA